LQTRVHSLRENNNNTGIGSLTFGVKLVKTDYLGYAPDIGNVNILYPNLQNLRKILQVNNYRYDQKTQNILLHHKHLKKTVSWVTGTISNVTSNNERISRLDIYTK
jgi:hypothetical protein